MLDYTINNDGGSFTVYIYDDFVIKVPKNEKVNGEKQLQHIADIQTEISKHVEGVFPCYRIGKKLFTQRAPGERVDGIWKEDKQFYRKLFAEKKQEIIDKTGYTLKDSGKANMFYDRESGQLYLVDFHLIAEEQ